MQSYEKMMYLCIVTKSLTQVKRLNKYEEITNHITNHPCINFR